jgi:hypothetical protein
MVHPFLRNRVNIVRQISQFCVSSLGASEASDPLTHIAAQSAQDRSFRFLHLTFVLSAGARIPVKANLR